MRRRRLPIAGGSKMKCRTPGCNRNTSGDDDLCIQCLKREYGFARRSMKKIMGVSSIKGIARGGRRY